MSRTYRKSRFTDERSLASHLKKEIAYYNARTCYKFSRYKNKSLDEVLAEEEVWYKRWNRDGTWSETSSKQHFKKMSKRNIRNKNKQIAHKILRGDEYEEPYTTDWHGKKFIWCVW